MIIICNTPQEVNDAKTANPVHHEWIDGAITYIYTGADKEAISPSPKLEDLIVRVKAEAQRRIFERYPQHKQGNMLSFVALIHEREKRSPGFVVTEAHLATLDTIDIANTWILAVRAASNLIEADLAIDQTTPIETSTRWPA